jgi:hypothetical protein
MTTGRVPVRGAAGAGAQDFFQQDDHARREVGVVAVQRGAGSARGQAATRIAPGVERNFVVVGVQVVNLFQGFESRVGKVVDARVVGDQRGLSGYAREEFRSAGQQGLARNRT